MNASVLTNVAVLTILLTACGGQATAAPAPTGATAMATATSAPPTAEKPALAGLTFSGPMGAGSITFTVSADGMAVEPRVELALNGVGCAEGGGLTFTGKMTLPDRLPIEAMTFRYGTGEVNPFMAGSGIELIGKFDSPAGASGTFKWIRQEGMNTCTLGPLNWTATAQ
jgi:hypothetical protein